MPIKAFTFYSLGRQLNDLARGFGVTVDHDIPESLIKYMSSPLPPDHLRDECRLLAKERGCEYQDLEKHRFIHFTKRYK